jgi:hypothetical protein
MTITGNPEGGDRLAALVQQWDTAGRPGVCDWNIDWHGTGSDADPTGLLRPHHWRPGHASAVNAPAPSPVPIRVCGAIVADLAVVRIGDEGNRYVEAPRSADLGLRAGALSRRSAAYPDPARDPRRTCRAAIGYRGYRHRRRSP